MARASYFAELWKFSITDQKDPGMIKGMVRDEVLVGIVGFFPNISVEQAETIRQSLSIKVDTAFPEQRTNLYIELIEDTGDARSLHAKIEWVQQQNIIHELNYEGTNFEFKEMDALLIFSARLSESFLETKTKKVRSTNDLDRSRLEVKNMGIRIDDEWFQFKGGPKTTERLSSFFTELIETKDYVTAKTFTVKTRDIEAQPSTIRDLLDDDAVGSAGSRIKPEYFKAIERFNETDIPF